MCGDSNIPQGTRHKFRQTTTEVPLPLSKREKVRIGVKYFRVIILTAFLSKIWQLGYYFSFSSKEFTKNKDENAALFHYQSPSPYMVEKYVIYSSSEEETIKIGEELGKLLQPGTIIGLIGKLGTGKTVLVKGIARGLNIQEEPNSPTFVIMNKYDGRTPLYHFDLYRISSAEELEGIGYEEYFFGDGVTVVEWSDRVEQIFPDKTIRIEITIPVEPGRKGENTRKINIEGKNRWLSSFKNTVEQALQT